MLLDRATYRLHFPWILTTLVLLCLAVAGYAYLATTHSTDRWPGGSSPIGLLLGIAAGLIFLFEFLYWPRRFRKVRAWRIGRAETWLRAHIWLGLLTLPLVFLHSGFRFGGSFTTVFMVVYLLVFFSGVWGLLLQQFLPRMLLADVPGETIHSQIPAVLAQAIDDTERMLARLRGGPRNNELIAPTETDQQLILGSPRQVGTLRQRVRSFGESENSVANLEALEAAWEREIKPYLTSPRPRSPQLKYASRATEYFQQLALRVGGGADDVVEHLAHACEQRRQFSRQQLLTFWLHSWLSIHLPLSLALMILLFVHVITALRYSVALF